MHMPLDHERLDNTEKGYGQIAMKISSNLEAFYDDKSRLVYQNEVKKHRSTCTLWSPV